VGIGILGNGAGVGETMKGVGLGTAIGVGGGELVGTGVGEGAMDGVALGLGSIDAVGEGKGVGEASGVGIGVGDGAARSSIWTSRSGGSGSITGRKAPLQ
jgi:hypothetical protein